ncbi:MAG TPA: bifunctional diaminohydroxyphosphoribosylaminopyrimidine deaminase/5-amino-6-(5-phosphoribosylamino)uracil reductase RibD [Saprospiraceae bacterium]|nr:bifunctional diaminohydroxyphosphoribosylaminopyrimidine deaminase/5-amino-6-(5-phosphoribosylamino)uracil reductase RibD [Saprospiraceae bacterium]
MDKHVLFMKRCFDLARMAAGNVSPNPMVGAVIVYNNKIIGEGFHQRYGEAHAEVNAIKSVRKKDLHLLHQSTIYVSLEPCCFYGNTPPCSKLIIENNIPTIVISCLDSTPSVAGKSVKLLHDAGREVIVGVLRNEGAKLFSARNSLVSNNRPYTILKYAKSADGFIGQKNKQVWLTNKFSKRLVHKWRSEVDAILVGTNTAKTDNPQLTNRLYFGKSPLRIAIDFNATIPNAFALLDQQTPTWIINNSNKNISKNNLQYISLPQGKEMIPELLRLLAKENKSSLLVEGGANLIHQFIDLGLWDEARVLQSPILLNNGISAPIIKKTLQKEVHLGTNKLRVYYN